MGVTTEATSTTETDDEGSPIYSFNEDQELTPEYQVKAAARVPTITAEALAAYAELDALSKKFDQRKKEREEKFKNSKTLFPKEDVSMEEKVDNDSMRFSDDDSLLARCAEEVELSQGFASTPNMNEAAKENLTDGFDSDDSTDMLMSQLDEHEMIAERASTPAHKEPLGPWNISPNVPRRYKSGNDRTLPKPAPSATAIRRIQSSPVVPMSRKCDKTEIQKKREEAKRRRELSQMRNTQMSN